MNEKQRFGNKVPFKAEGDDSDEDTSSEGKSDHLSYSYSCVKSFRRNQHIIGDLAALQNQPEFQGTSHQPVLFSLSGERNRPVCQPFYCSADPEQSDALGEEPKQAYRQERPPEEKEKHLTTTEDQHQSPGKDKFVHWLKQHFKHVNSLWPFNIPKDIFVTKLCKKNQKMKMEMTLNGVNEETKLKLINYINQFNLSFEEHCNICTGNETVFEIDVTSILHDKYRLQSFLTLLKNIESEENKVPVENDKTTNAFKCDVGSEDEITITEKDGMKEKVDNQTKTSAALGESNFSTYSLSSTSIDSNKNFELKQQQCTLEQVEKNLEEDVNINTHSNSKKVSDEIEGEKRTRKISTLSGVNCEQNVDVVWAPGNTQQDFTLSKPKKVHFEHNVFRVQTNIAANQVDKVGKETSCKCLLHHNREDYYRYKNQCLFGQGDEINNSFIRYINKNKNDPELSLDFNEIQQNNFSYESDRDESSEAVENQNIAIGKTCLPDNLKKNTSINLKNDNHSTPIVLSAHQAKSLKEIINPQRPSIGNFEDSFCLNELSSSTADDDESNSLKRVATNACFKSLNYCNKSHELSVKVNKKEETQCLSQNINVFYNMASKGDPKILQKSFSKPIGHYCNKCAEEKESNNTNSSIKSCSHNTKNEYNIFLKNNNELNIIKRLNKNSLENVQLQSDCIVLNEQELKEHIWDESYTSDKDEIGETHSSISNLSIAEAQIISSEQLTDSPTNDKGFIITETDVSKGEKSIKRKSKIKTIVFKIGTSNKDIEVGSIPSYCKGNSKFKTLKPKEVCKKLSSVFKGNESADSEECSQLKINNKKCYKTLYNNSTNVDKSFTNKSDMISDSWVSVDECSSIMDSPARHYGSKNTSQTPNSVNCETSSLTENSLGILISELRNQRMEIDYMKNLLRTVVK